MTQTRMFVLIGAALVTASLPALRASPVVQRGMSSLAPCRVTAAVTGLPGLTESSGLAASRVAERLWTHNDSGQPVLFTLDASGKTTGRVRLTGATVEDWEAIAVGPCPLGSCVYVGDIGDNRASRRRITVYRFRDMADLPPAVPATDIYHAVYPDGPHDAETLIVTPGGELFVVTKGDGGPVAVYKFPRDLKSGAVHPLERVGEPRGAPRVEASDRITDGSASPDGQWIALRTNARLMFYRSADFESGTWRQAASADLRSVGEAQGEGVALGGDGIVYLSGEAGGKLRSGTFARLHCSLP